MCIIIKFVVKKCNEIALLVPLDFLNMTGGNHIKKYSKTIEDEYLTLKNTFNIEPPLNFKHLTLINLTNKNLNCKSK